MLLGIFGSIDFPGLKGAAANSVLVKMIDLQRPRCPRPACSPPESLPRLCHRSTRRCCPSATCSPRCRRHYRKGDELSEKGQVLLGPPLRDRHLRRYLRALAGLSPQHLHPRRLVLHRLCRRSSQWSSPPCSGSAAPSTVPLPPCSPWPRCGAISSFRGWKIPGYTVGMTGVMPVVVILAASAVAMIVGSLLTKPPAKSTVEKFF